MDEGDVRKTVIDALKRLDAVSVENVLGVGTPDVNHLGGWIELKYVPSWPKRPETVLHFEKFYPQQRAWITRRVRAGGLVHVLVRISSDWLLFDGLAAASGLGRWNRAECILRSAKFWMKRLDKAEFAEYMSERVKAHISKIG